MTRCEMSDLLERECAHCTGAVADFEMPPAKVEIYG